MSHSEDSTGDDLREELSDLIVRSYSPVGFVNGLGYAKAEVEAREGLIPGRHVVSLSVKVELTTGGDYPQTAATAISYDNVDRFIAAVKRLRTANIQTDRFEFTELEFEIDELKVIVFNTANGNLMFAISTGAISVHFNGLNQLASFQGLLEKAKTHLDTFGRR